VKQIQRYNMPLGPFEHILTPRLLKAKTGEYVLYESYKADVNKRIAKVLLHLANNGLDENFPRMLSAIEELKVE